MGESDYCYYYYYCCYCYAVATVNVPMSNSNDVNLANTLGNYEIVVSFDRINKLDRDYRKSSIKPPGGLIFFKHF